MYQICGTLTPKLSKAHFLLPQHTKYLVHGMCEPTFGTLSRFRRIWYIGSMYQIDSNLVSNWPGVMVLNSATNTDIVRDLEYLSSKNDTSERDDATSAELDSVNRTFTETVRRLVNAELYVVATDARKVTDIFWEITQEVMESIVAREQGYFGSRARGKKKVSSTHLEQGPESRYPSKTFKVLQTGSLLRPRLLKTGTLSSASATVYRLTLSASHPSDPQSLSLSPHHFHQLPKTVHYVVLDVFRGKAAVHLLEEFACALNLGFLDFA